MLVPFFIRELASLPANISLRNVVLFLIIFYSSVNKPRNRNVIHYMGKSVKNTSQQLLFKDSRSNCKIIDFHPVSCILNFGSWSLDRESCIFVQASHILYLLKDLRIRLIYGVLKKSWSPKYLSRPDA
jgi:hypothetical protein